MHSTNAVDVSIHAVSPLLGVGAGVACAPAAGAAGAGAASFFSSAFAAGASAAGLSAGLSCAMTGIAPKLNAPISASVVNIRFIYFSLITRQRRFRRCGCDKLAQDRKQKSF